MAAQPLILGQVDDTHPTTTKHRHQQIPSQPLPYQRVSAHQTPPPTNRSRADQRKRSTSGTFHNPTQRHAVGATGEGWFTDWVGPEQVGAQMEHPREVGAGAGRRERPWFESIDPTLAWRLAPQD